MYCTREEVVDAHAMFQVSFNSERQTMEVHGMILFISSHVQQVPSGLLVLGHQQTRECLRHVAVDC